MQVEFSKFSLLRLPTKLGVSMEMAVSKKSSPFTCKAREGTPETKF